MGAAAAGETPANTDNATMNSIDDTPIGVSEDAGGAEMLLGASNDSNSTLLSGDNNEGSFTDLDAFISENRRYDGIVTLDKDYKFNEQTDTDFSEGLYIGGYFTIEGNGHTIDANNQAKIFSVGGENVILKNIRFINSNSEAIKLFGINDELIDCIFEYNNIGVSITTAKNSKITNSKFINNTVGIESQTSNNLIINGSLFNMDQKACLLSGNVTIADSTFDGNLGSEGSAIRIYDGSDITIINSNFTNNYASSSLTTVGGAAIFADGNTNLNISGSRFINNSAYTGGAILSRGNLNINHCDFNNNTARCVDVDYSYVNGGGAIRMFMGYLNIAYSNFTNNSADIGGAISVRDNLNPGNITNSLFDNNYARTSAVIAYKNKNTNNLEITNCTITNNVALSSNPVSNKDIDDSVNTLKDNNLLKDIDEFVNLFSNKTQTLIKLEKDYNVQYGVTLWNGLTIDGQGHTLYSKTGTIFTSWGENVVFKDIVFNGNNIKTDSPMIFSTVNNMNIQIDECKFINGSRLMKFSNNRGISAGTVNINNCEFINNTNDYLIDLTRGSNNMALSSFIINNSNFTNNFVSNNGLIYFAKGPMIIDYCNFTNNHGSIPTLALKSLTSYTVSNSRFESNSGVFNISDVDLITNKTEGNIVIFNNTDVNNDIDPFIKLCKDKTDIQIDSDLEVLYGGLTYTDKNISINGNGYTIDANNFNVFTFENCNVTIKDLNIIDAESALIFRNCNVTINNLNITNCTSPTATGGALSFNNCNISIDDLTTKGGINTMIYIINCPTSTTTVTISNSNILDNTVTAKPSGAIDGAIIIRNSDVVMDNILFENNIGRIGANNALAEASSINSYMSNVTIKKSRFVNNTPQTAIIYSEVNSNLTIEESRFEGNNKSNIIRSKGSSLVVDSSEFSDNAATLITGDSATIKNSNFSNSKQAAINLNNITITGCTFDNAGVSSINASIKNTNFTNPTFPIKSSNYPKYDNVRYNGELIDTKSFSDLFKDISDNSTIMVDDNYTIWGVILLNNKNIVIDGNNNTIDANGLNIFNILSENVTIKNFIIVNGTGITSSGANTQIINCVFENNNRALTLNADNASVKDSKFINNHATNGGAVYFNSNGNVSGCQFIDNFASMYGGAVYFNSNGNVSGCEFINSTARADGGAVYFRGDGNVDNTTFEGNTADTGAGISSSGSLNVSGSDFDSNTAFIGAGVVSSGPIEIADSNFNNNSAQVAGALLLKGDNASVSGVNLTNNTAAVKGGGIMVSGDNIKLNNINATGNSAPSGSAFVLDGDGAKLENSNVTGNKGVNGEGSAVEVNGENIDILNNTIKGNDGAGVLVNGNGTNITGNQFNSTRDISINPNSDIYNNETIMKKLQEENQPIEYVEILNDVDPTIIVSDVNVQQETRFNITILNPDFEGNVSVKLDDGSLIYNGTFENIKNNDSIISGPVLPVAGEKTVTVFFYGDPDFINKTVNTTFIVSRVTPQMNITIANVTYGNNSIVEVRIGNKANGTITITIDDIEITSIPIVDGNVTYDLGGLPAGNKTANVQFRYNTSDYYNNNVGNSTVFCVDKAESSISIVVNDTYDIGEDVNITVSTTGSSGNLTFKINDTEYPVVNGIVNITSGLALGEYTITATLDADENYTNTEVTKTFTIKKINYDLSS